MLVNRESSQLPRRSSITYHLSTHCAIMSTKAKQQDFSYYTLSISSLDLQTIKSQTKHSQANNASRKWKKKTMENLEAIKYISTFLEIFKLNMIGKD